MKKIEYKFAARFSPDVMEILRTESAKSRMSINEYLNHVVIQHHKLDLAGRLSSLEMTIAKLTGFPEE